MQHNAFVPLISCWATIWPVKDQWEHTIAITPQFLQAFREDVGRTASRRHGVWATLGEEGRRQRKGREERKREAVVEGTSHGRLLFLETELGWWIKKKASLHVLLHQKAPKVFKTRLFPQCWNYTNTYFKSSHKKCELVHIHHYPLSEHLRIL